MSIVLKVNDLNYRDFHNINLSFEFGKLYFVVGHNKSGKTTLFRLLSSLIFVDNSICCNNILLRKNTKNLYLKQIGMVERLNDYSFSYKGVKDEMLYPLINLGYSYYNAIERIKEVLAMFELDRLFFKRICDLNYNEKQILLIMISILHQPKILLLDNVLEIFSKKERRKILQYLKEMINQYNMTIINFTSNLQDIMESDRIILLSNFKIIKETTYHEIFYNDQLFYDNGLQIPFTFDLVNKLKLYGLINKDYMNMKEMVDDIWP